MNVAANSLIDFLSSDGFCHTVIACKSTIQYKVSFPALWNFTKFLTALNNFLGEDCQLVEHQKKFFVYDYYCP